MWVLCYRERVCGYYAIGGVCGYYAIGGVYGYYARWRWRCIPFQLHLHGKI